MISNPSPGPDSPELALVDRAAEPGSEEHEQVLPSAPAWSGAPAEFEIASPKPDPCSEPEIATPTPAAFDVHVHLVNGERIHVASFADEAGAKRGCRELADRLSTVNGWPFFAGRFVRPDAIVSLDLEPAAERPAR